MSNIVEGFRLSRQQRQAWLCDQDGQRQRSQCAVLLEGKLNSRRLRKALRAVVSRNTILRTTYHRQRGMRLPIQVVSDSAEVLWSEAELAGEGFRKDEDGIEDFLRQERYKPFDLDQDPPMHSSLLALPESRHLWVISLPSLSSDYLTLGNVVEQTSRLYGSGLKTESAFEEPVQYAQFCEWQNEAAKNGDSGPGKEYWQKQALATAWAFPLSRPRQSEGETRLEPQSLDLLIDARLSEEIKATAQRLDVAESVLLMACWRILIWRMTGSADVVINSYFDGRAHSELREAMGLFATWLPMHSFLEGSSTCRQVVCRINEATREVSQWVDSFTSQESGDENNSAAFPSAFEYQLYPARYTAAGLLFSVYKQSSCEQQFKVKLSCVRRENLLTAEFHYNPACYDEANIKRLSGHFHALLASVISEPDRPISELDILREGERRQIIEEWNDTASPYPHELCVHELFEQQAERTPGSVAVVYGDQQLSYAEINAGANRLAHHLRRLGVAPEVRVGLMIERSVEMIVGLLAVLKAGGAYVPLDLHYPAERLGLMLEDARITVLLTQQRLVGKLPPSDCAVVVLDSDSQVIDEESEINPERAAEPNNLAYILYTSGSTGKPKGVMITHGGVVNYLAWCARAYAVAEGQGAPVHSPIGFDLTVTSLFAPLIVGQRLVLLAEAQGATTLCNLVCTGAEFSLIKLTPSHLEMLSQLLPADKAAGLTKALIIGGEALFGKDLAFWRANAAGTRIINEYGPTESVVGCCVYELADDDCLSGTMPIGMPIANMQMYVLDANLQPVPIGVTGELYVGGVGVARGYVNQAGFTAEKFIPDPFGRAGGTRLYMTGDLGRHLPDGNIEFLGRRDTQVKIRGYRIELGEIEQTLQQHQGVREAVVIAGESNHGERRLVAYVVGEPGYAPKPHEMRQYLKERLPDYMLPAAWAVLERLPLTPNGKADQRALLEMEALSLKSGIGYVPPETELEAIIATLWQEALEVEKVGVNDNFFDLGGHSFLILQINEKLQELLGGDLSMMDMFQYPTVSLLAKSLSQSSSQQSSPERSQLRVDSRNSSARRQRERRAQNRAANRQLEADNEG